MRALIKTWKTQTNCIQTTQGLLLLGQRANRKVLCAGICKWGGKQTHVTTHIDDVTQKEHKQQHFAKTEELRKGRGKALSTIRTQTNKKNTWTLLTHALLRTRIQVTFSKACDAGLKKRIGQKHWRPEVTNEMQIYSQKILFESLRSNRLEKTITIYLLITIYLKSVTLQQIKRYMSFTSNIIHYFSSH